MRDTSFFTIVLPLLGTIVALLGVIAAYYFGWVQYFREVDDFKLRVSSPIRYGIKSHLMKGNVPIELAFINNGTGRYLISFGNLLFGKDINLTAPIQHGLIVEQIQTFKFKIKPKSSEAKIIDIPNKYIINPEDPRPFVGIEFDFIDSRGEKYHRRILIINNGLPNIDGVFNLLGKQRNPINPIENKDK